MNADEALALLDGMTEMCVARGKKVVRIDLSAAGRPPDSELVKLMVSRWGRLRAPAMKVGTTLVIGYNGEMLGSVFGIR